MGGLFRGVHFQFLVQVVRGRWFMFFAALLIQAGSGTTYIYSLYSKEIRESLGYDDDAMSRIAFFRDVGASMAFFNGLFAEVIPTWLGLVVSGAMNFGGYLMVWLAVMGKIPRPKVWQMCAYIAVAVNAPNFSCIALSSCVQNFPTSRGVVLGLMKGLVGLSGAILTQLYIGIFGNERKGLILLLALLPASVSILFMFTIRKIESERRPNELRVFLYFFYMTILLALFLMVMYLLEKYVFVTKEIHQKSAVVVIILLFLPLTLVIKEEAAIWKHKKRTASPAPDQITIDRSQASTPQASPVDSYTQLEEKAEGSCFANIFNKPERGEDHTILQAILSIDMFYILIITLCGYGTALTSFEQLGPIGLALKYHERLVSTIIALASIWNYYGRVYSGFVSELLLTKWKLPRSIMMVFVLLLHCTGLLLVAFPAIPGAYYVASVILGFTLGAQVPINLVIISELFGLKHYATLLSFASIASPVGVYLMNTRLTKVLYAKEAARELVAAGKNPSTVTELTCTGHNCFRVSFSILAAIAFVGALVSLQFARRTREFYKGDIYKRFRVEKCRRGDTFKRYNGETYVRFEEGAKATTEIEMAQSSGTRTVACTLTWVE